ncbi:uncharacterized protein TNCV_3004941 [Trichonephila clavipes]|nr:uncharacterized protein TNCV_3004941 [Trichonephila clavipes]
MSCDSNSSTSHQSNWDKFGLSNEVTSRMFFVVAISLFGIASAIPNELSAALVNKPDTSLPQNTMMGQTLKDLDIEICKDNVHLCPGTAECCKGEDGKYDCCPKASVPIAASSRQLLETLMCELNLVLDKCFFNAGKRKIVTGSQIGAVWGKVTPDLLPKLSQQFLSLASYMGSSSFPYSSFPLAFRQLQKNDTISLPVVYSLLHPRTLPRFVCQMSDREIFLAHKNRIMVHTSVQDHFSRRPIIAVALTGLSTPTICSHKRFRPVSIETQSLKCNDMGFIRGQFDVGLRNWNSIKTSDAVNREKKLFILHGHSVPKENSVPVLLGLRGDDTGQIPSVCIRPILAYRMSQVQHLPDHPG